jgi:tetratricopeptide (TPR) repeat protein
MFSMRRLTGSKTGFSAFAGLPILMTDRGSRELRPAVRTTKVTPMPNLKTSFGFLFLVFPLLILNGCSKKLQVTSSSPEALQWYARGLSLYEKFYYREAQEAIAKAIAADSGFAMAWARQAIISYNLGDSKAAEEAIGRASRLSDRSARWEQMVIRMWKSRIEFKGSQTASIADSIIREYPSVREAYLVRGQEYEMVKNTDAAIHMYQQAIELDSIYAPAIMSLGYAYSTLGNVDRATEYMERYIRLLPNEADPRASFGDILLRAGRYDEALAQYRKSLEVKADYWYSIQRIGDIDAILGRLQSAGTRYHRALDLLPRSSRTEGSSLTIDGRLNLLRGEYEKALGEFREALQRDSTLGEAAFLMVSALTRLKQYDQADTVIARTRAELARRHLLDSPTMASFYRMRAAALETRGQYNEALMACDSALQFSVPINRGSIYNEIAKIRLGQKEIEPAIDACEQALSVNPNSPEILLTLLKAYHAKKDVRMTVEIGSRLLAVWAEADSDFVGLKEVQQILGRGNARAA